jgi:hypothetical protein
MPDMAQLCYDLWQDRRTLRLLPGDAKVSGCTALMNGDFDVAAGTSGSATWECPGEGKRHIALILRDQPGALEALDVLVSGTSVGTLVGASASGGDVIHYTASPIALTKGEPIEVRTAGDGGPLRFGNVCLLAERPGVPPLTIENLAAWHIPDEPGEPPGRVMIAWTTNRPAEGRITYALADPEARVEEGVLEEGRGPVNNHFVMLPPELSASGYQLTVTCRELPQATYEPRTATQSYTVWRDPAQHRAAQGGPAAAEAKLTRIALTVHEPTAHSRRAWPVSSGIPLPDGALRDGAACRVLDGGSKPVPAQFRPLSQWSGSGCVKWLLVDFLADTQAGADSAYVLECGAQAEPVKSLMTVTARPADGGAASPGGQPVGAVSLPAEIGTGPLALQLSEGGFAPFARVRINGKPVSDAPARECGFELTDADGTVYSSALSPPEEVVVEERGPVRATLRVAGKLANADGKTYMRYVCRMHLYSGKPWVRVLFSLDNDVVQPDMNLVGNLRLRVPAPLANAAFAFGADGKAAALEAGGRLVQDEDNHFAAGGLQGRRADGWLLGQSPAATVAVAVRDFWQLYPKGFEADDGGLTIELLPKLPEAQYAGASEDDVTKLYFWCDGGRYKVRTGVRLTTEFAVDFAPQIEGEPPRYAAGELWQSPLFAACAPEWYCSSGAFGPMTPRAEGKFDVYERSLDSAFGKFLARRESVREYGFMNYGDWFGERTWNWGNIEYDTQWALAASFARTGNLDMLWRAEEAEWHNADIDTTHYWANPADVGRVFTHCTGHTGGYFPDTWKNMGGFNRGPRDTGHTWCQGHYCLYAVTGERRYLETGRIVADWLAEHTTDFHYYSERNVGWPMVALMSAYDATGNPWYLNGAKLMADMAVWTQPPESGGWGHFIDPNECKHTPRCWGCKPFMTGVLLHGLKLYDLAQPRDDVKRAIRKNCDFLWREAYIPRDNGFIYSQCRSFSDKGSAWTISLVGDGLAYGCLMDPDHRHKDLLLRATEGFMYGAGIGDFGKSFTQGTCFMPHMLHDLDALGLTSMPVRAADE